MAVSETTILGAHSRPDWPGPAYRCGDSSNGTATTTMEQHSAAGFALDERKGRDLIDQAFGKQGSRDRLWCEPQGGVDCPWTQTMRGLTWHRTELQAGRPYFR